MVNPLGLLVPVLLVAGVLRTALATVLHTGCRRGVTKGHGHDDRVLLPLVLHSSTLSRSNSALHRSNRNREPASPRPRRNAARLGPTPPRTRHKG